MSGIIMIGGNRKPAYPVKIEAESAILGAILLESSAMARACDLLLSPDYFNHLPHTYIFKACLNLFARSAPIDLVTVKDELNALGLLNDAGTPMYLVQLTSAVASSANIEYHCRIVVEAYLRKRLYQLNNYINEKTTDDGADIFTTLDNIEKLIMKLTQQNTHKGFEHISNVLVGEIQRMEYVQAHAGELMGLPSGWYELDDMTNGFIPADLIIVGGRPSMGKTAFACNIARNASKYRGAKVAFYSIESPSNQIINRMLQAEANVTGDDIAKGNLETADWQRLNTATSLLADLPIFVDDTAGITISELRSKARKMKNEKGLDLIVIDYLQKIKGVRNTRNRDLEVGEVSNGLKELAKELNIPIIALAQIGRSSENNADKRPSLKDLRESGNIEADADQVYLLYRPEYYGIKTDEAGDDITGQAEIIIAKNRNGKTGSVMLRFMGDIMKFESLSDGHKLLPKPTFTPSTRLDDFLNQDNSAPF